MITQETYRRVNEHHGSRTLSASQAGLELLGRIELLQELLNKIGETDEKKQEDYGKCQAYGYSFQYICNYAHARIVQTIFVKSGDSPPDLMTKAYSVTNLLRDIYKIIMQFSSNLI